MIMRILALAAVLGCAKKEAPPAPMPVPEPVRQDASARARAAVDKTRTQKSYSVSFTAMIQAPDSDKVTIKGESVWIAPGVLFTQYLGAGGDEVRLVRAGEEVWLWHVMVEDWVTAEEAGKAGAGRGVQNPDEVLQAILKVADQAVTSGKAPGGDVLEMKLDGPALQKVMKQQAMDGKLDFANSSGTLKLVLDPSDGLMHGMQVNADVASTEPHLKGKKIGYSADVTLKSYNKDFGLEFKVQDLATGKSVTIPWAAEFLDKAEKVKGIPDELKAEIQKRRKK
jgi:hypothetical protein